jgi:hypothetical protein
MIHLDNHISGIRVRIVERLRYGLYHECLGETGNSDQESVAAGESEADIGSAAYDGYISGQFAGTEAAAKQAITFTNRFSIEKVERASTIELAGLPM